MFQSELRYYRISNFLRPLVKKIYHGSKNASFLGPKIQDMLPDDCNDIRLSNKNLKIFLEYSVKFTLVIQVFFQKGKRRLRIFKQYFWNYGCCVPVSFCYQCFLFYLFNRLFIAYWISRFLYLYRNQFVNSLITIT